MTDTGDVYAQLYAQHSGAVLTYLNNKMRDPETAQDVAQDTWLKAHRFLPGVLAEGGDGGKSWLLRIAATSMLDHFRRIKARPKTEDLAAALSPGTTVSDALMDWDTPERAAVNDAESLEQRATAAVFLQLLPRPERRLLWLREWRGYSHAQIAVVLQCTAPAIKARLWRVREVQRTIWEREHIQVALGRGTISRLWHHIQGGREWALAHPNDCWPWLGNRTRGRPGTISAPSHLLSGRPQNPSAPRVLYAVVRGVLPPWACLSPACPMLGCINPFHRRIVSKAGPGGTYRPAALELDRPDDSEAVWLEANAMHQRRMALAVTEDTLAAEAGLTQENVARIEHRVLVNPPTLAAIEAALTRLESRLTPLTVATPETLRARRLAAGLTRAQLAAGAGVGWRSVHRLETSQNTKASSCRRRIQDFFDRLEREQQESAA